MSIAIFATPSASTPWLRKVWDDFRTGKQRRRLDAELEVLTDERLRDIGVVRGDITTRFRTEMRKVERLGLTDYGRC